MAKKTEMNVAHEAILKAMTIETDKAAARLSKQYKNRVEYKLMVRITEPNKGKLN